MSGDGSIVIMPSNIRLDLMACLRRVRLRSALAARTATAQPTVGRADLVRPVMWALVWVYTMRRRRLTAAGARCSINQRQTRSRDDVRCRST